MVAYIEYKRVYIRKKLSALTCCALSVLRLKNPGSKSETPVSSVQVPSLNVNLTSLRIHNAALIMFPSLIQYHVVPDGVLQQCD